MPLNKFASTYSSTTLGRTLEAISAVVWAFALVIGTYAQFALPRWHGGPRPFCYFTDALIVFIECSESYADGLTQALLNWAWYWTWGISWVVGLMAMGISEFRPANLLPLGLVGLHLGLEVLTAFFAVRFVKRLLRKPV